MVESGGFFRYKVYATHERRVCACEKMWAKHEVCLLETVLRGKAQFIS